jgi:hypothetical protein
VSTGSGGRERGEEQRTGEVPMRVAVAQNGETNAGMNEPAKGEDEDKLKRRTSICFIQFHISHHTHQIYIHHT